MMQIKSDFALKWEEKDLIAVQGPQFKKLLARPNVKIAFENVKQRIMQMIDPQVAWNIVPIQGIQHDQFVLTDGKKVGGGPVTDHMLGAKELAVVICTIGPKIDAEIQRLQHDKQMMEAIIFDTMASYFVAQLEGHFIEWLDSQYSPRGWHLSLPLGPGESKWDIKGLKDIFDLVDSQQIGVRLTDSMLMVPMKSLSFVIGLNDQAFDIMGKSKCDYCMSKDTCRERALMLAQGK